jgi:hypothetical protein
MSFDYETDGKIWAGNALTTLKELEVPVNSIGQCVFIPAVNSDVLRKIKFAAYELDRSIESLMRHFEKKDE